MGEPGSDLTPAELDAKALLDRYLGHRVRLNWTVDSSIAIFPDHTRQRVPLSVEGVVEGGSVSLSYGHCSVQIVLTGLGEYELGDWVTISDLGEYRYDVDVTPPAAEIEGVPDRAICKHCGQPISFSEFCFVHDDTGFADCGIILTRTSDGERVTVQPPSRRLVGIDVSGGSDTFAEPR